MAQGRFEIDSMCRSVNIPLYRPITGISGRMIAPEISCKYLGTMICLSCECAMLHYQALIAPYLWPQNSSTCRLGHSERAAEGRICILWHLQCESPSLDIHATPLLHIKPRDPFTAPGRASHVQLMVHPIKPRETFLAVHASGRPLHMCRARS